MMLSDTEGGIRLLLKKACKASLNSLKSGNAVKRDSTTANKGTIDNTVVKVRLAASCTVLASAARCVARPKVWLAFLKKCATCLPVKYCFAPPCMRIPRLQAIIAATTAVECFTDFILAKTERSTPDV